MCVDSPLCLISTPTRRVIALAGFVLFSVHANAAGLGDVRVRSALGERFDATVSISLLEGEVLTDACFQLVSSATDPGMHSLRNARASFRKLGQGGEVRILGTESEQEPVLKLALRLRCPEDTSRGITREYNVLLDPRDSKFQPPPVIEQAVVAPTATTRPSNPDRQSPPRERKVRPARVAAPEQPLVLPELRAETTVKPRQAAKPGRPAANVSEQGRGEFKLKLSITPLDPNAVNLNLSEEEKLEIRERLMVNESDDQSAQMLLLKDKIAHLEKRILALQVTQASAIEASPPPQLHVETTNRNGAEHATAWLWGGIALLLISMLGFLFWRWKVRNQMEQNFFSFDSEINGPETLVLEDEHLAAPIKNTPRHNTVSGPMTGGEEWGAAQMDVVSPGNVAEEAQLLLDHGLMRQAIELLLHEIGLRGPVRIFV